METARRALLALIAAFAWTLGMSPCGAQETAEPEAVRRVCRTMLCRPEGFIVRLDMQDGKPREWRTRGPLPIAQNDRVTIYPGETLFIEADLDGDRLVHLRAVSRNDVPQKTIELRFRQMTDRPAMVLEVLNPFPRPMKYHAAMMLPTGEQLYQTTTCPVPSKGRFAIEEWPNPIFQALLFDFHLTDPDGPQACVF